MAKTLNIEVIKQHKLKHTALLLAICALLLACLVGALPNTKAQYTTADQDSHVFVFSKDQDVRVGLTEDGWTTKSGLDLRPGDIRTKQPVVQNLADDCFMRVNMRITDKEGNTIDPNDSTTSERLDLILNTIFYVPDDSVLPSEVSSSQIETLVSQGKINRLSNLTNFSKAKWNSEMQAYNFNYTNAASANVFTNGSNATLFNRIIIPTDYTNTQLLLMDEYYINIWVQAIQPEGFTTSDDALSKLSNDAVPNNIEELSNSKSV